MSVGSLFHDELQGEWGLGIVFDDIDIGCSRGAIVSDRTNPDEGRIAQLAAFQEALKVDTELAAFEDVRAFRQAPGTAADPRESSLLHSSGQLWFDEDVELLEHDLGLRCERRVIGEEIDSQVIVGAG